MIIILLPPFLTPYSLTLSTVIDAIKRSAGTTPFSTKES